MNYNDNQLDEIFASLPEELQDYIMSPEVSEALEDIVSKRKISQEDIFRQEVYLTLLGLQSTKDLADYMAGPMKIDSDTATQILFDLDEKIFDGARAVEKKADSTPDEEATPTKQSLINEIENPHPSEMKTVIAPRPAVSSVSATTSQTPNNLPVMPEHHELMKYYTGTEPIVPTDIDYSGPVPLIKKTDQPKLADTPRYDAPKYVPPQNTKIQPRYNPGNDPYRESSR